jgi:hypothetical protein
MIFWISAVLARMIKNIFKNFLFIYLFNSPHRHTKNKNYKLLYCRCHVFPTLIRMLLYVKNMKNVNYKIEDMYFQGFVTSYMRGSGFLLQHVAKIA